MSAAKTIISSYCYKPFLDMRLSARTKVVLNKRQLEEMGSGFAQELSDELARRTAELARENVAIGSGPGPHPHRPGSEHIDTGDLRASIKTRREHWRALPHATAVYTEVDYGLYLEVGWTNPWSGNFWRYPWLGPAMGQASDEWGKYAKLVGERWFTPGAANRGRIGIASPLEATWKPGESTGWDEE